MIHALSSSGIDLVTMLPMKPRVVSTPSGPASALIVSYSDCGVKIAPEAILSSSDQAGLLVIIGIWSISSSLDSRSGPNRS